MSSKSAAAEAAPPAVERLPILIVPGIMSSGLEVRKSPYGPDKVGQRVWINPVAIGTSKLYKGRALQREEEEVQHGSSPLTTGMHEFKRVAAHRNLNASKVYDLDDPEDSDAEEEDLYERPGDMTQTEYKAELKCKSAWLQHLSLSGDMVNEREGCEVRPIPGLDGVDFLTDLATIKVGASYVFGPVINYLCDRGGYTRGVDLDAVPYDWRIPPKQLEDRDSYFTKTMERIERMFYETDGKPVVLVCHSMGTKCGHYLLNFAKIHRGQEWLDRYVHTYMPVGGPHIGAPSTIGSIYMATMNPMLDPLLTIEERLIFGRNLGSLPWIMPPSILPGVAAIPALFCRHEGTLEISFDQPLGDCDMLVRTNYGTRTMDSVKLFIRYLPVGKDETNKKDWAQAHSKASESEEWEGNATWSQSENWRGGTNSKFFRIKETFAFPTPPTTDSGLGKFELVLREKGACRAWEIEKHNKVLHAFTGLQKVMIFHHGAKSANNYGMTVARSTKQDIDVKALLESDGYEMEVPVVMHARVDMHFKTLRPKEGSRHITAKMRVKWIPPLSSSDAAETPIAELPSEPTFTPALSISSKTDAAVEYRGQSGSTMLKAENMGTCIKVTDEMYDQDLVSPRKLSSSDAPPVKRCYAVYGINVPTQVSSICCRSRHFVEKKGKFAPRFVPDESAELGESTKALGYELVDGMVIKETPRTPQKDLISGETVHKCGDGTVPYWSLQHCQLWKTQGCDVRIDELEGAPHREILSDERFHELLLRYCAGIQPMPKPKKKLSM